MTLTTEDGKFHCILSILITYDDGKLILEITWILSPSLGHVGKSLQLVKLPNGNQQLMRPTIMVIEFGSK